MALAALLQRQPWAHCRNGQVPPTPFAKPIFLFICRIYSEKISGYLRGDVWSNEAWSTNLALKIIEIIPMISSMVTVIESQFTPPPVTRRSFSAQPLEVICPWAIPGRSWDGCQQSPAVGVRGPSVAASCKLSTPWIPIGCLNCRLSLIQFASTSCNTLSGLNIKILKLALAGLLEHLLHGACWPHSQWRQQCSFDCTLGWTCFRGNGFLSWVTHHTLQLGRY